MSDLRCPVCKEDLQHTDRCYRCKNSHTFDVAAAGYVNLLLVHKTHTKSPGDNKEMMAARRRFLDGGYYELLSDGINRWAEENLTMSYPRVIDAGCGEGYYTARFKQYMQQKGIGCRVLGFDISKHGLQIAAKRCKDVSFAVASVFEMPLQDQYADCILSLFAPYSEEEYRRVLKKGGFFLLAVPLPRHLFGLKELLYEKPYENEPKDLSLEGFELVDKIQLETTVTVEGEENIKSLFHMTPYYWHTPREAAARLDGIQSLTTPLGFELLIYKAQ